MAKGKTVTASRSSFGSLLNKLEMLTGYRPDDGDLSIPDEMTFREWCEKLASDGLKIDGKPFRLDNRAALMPIYDLIPTTREEAYGLIIVVQKATQLGLTVWEVLANLYMALRFEPLVIGMFMPDQSTASYKSERRFMPIVRSVPDIYKRLTRRLDDDGKTKKIGEGNVLTRVMGESAFLFLWTSGKVSTESRPMDVVTLDEVQEMSLDQIDKVFARTGDSDIQLKLLLSTANMPEADINYWYLLGNQMVWHTECPHCKKLSDLSDPAGNFPGKSITYNNGQFDGAPIDYVWTCPECGGWIRDPQIGAYVAANPGADPKIISLLVPRTVSPRITPRQMIEGWRRAKTGHQKKSFYNRVLARPYIDADQLPVTMAHCLAAAELGMKMGLRWESSGRDTYMGIDQMGGFNAVIIKRRLPDGRQAVVHVEAVFDLDPFERCAKLMDQYGVAVCVVEQLPNVNDARRFANRFPGRAFLAGYADLKDDMMVWGDALSESDAKTAVEDRSRYSVTLNQYKCMQTALYRIRDGFCLFPDPSALEQDVVEDGRVSRILIARDWVFLHFTKVALVVEQKEEERKPKAKVMKVGIDPHYAYANMLCDVAWARLHGTSTFILPDQPDPVYASPVAESVIPAALSPLLVPPVVGTCGACVAFDAESARCTSRGFIVRAADPACPVYFPTK